MREILGGRFEKICVVVAGVMDDPCEENFGGMDADKIFFLSARSYGCGLPPPF